MAQKETVLVTGATGYLGAWTAKVACESGLYRVRGTTRSLTSSRAKQLKKLHPDIELFEVDLLKDDGWAEAFKGVNHVLHTASPFNADPNFDYVTPAVEGTKRVLKFAKIAKVKSVIVTSSQFSVILGNDLNGKTVDAKMWSNTGVLPEKSYALSKPLAEKVAWDWKKDNPSIKLHTVCPGLIVGPTVLGTSGGTLDYWQFMSSKEKLGDALFFWVDVRDVAEMHVNLISSPDDKLRLMCTQVLPVIEPFIAVAKEFGPQGYKFPTQTTQEKEGMPYDAWMGAKFTMDNKEAKKYTNKKDFRSINQSCIEMHGDFIKNGCVQKST